MKRPSQSTRSELLESLVAPPLRRIDRTHRLTLEASHSGGAESWWLVRCRGREWRFPGHLQFEDVMAALTGERPYRSRTIQLAEGAGHAIWTTVEP